MGSPSSRLIRLPNSEAWIEKDYVVAVARMNDSATPPTKAQQEADQPGIIMLNWQIRLADGKAINFQHHDRVTIAQFLNSIGVSWDA